MTSQSAYLAVWGLLGAGMRLCLYNAAFGVSARVPTRGRVATSYLTVFGAFASSVFWVVGHYLNESGGWRQTLVAFSAINLAICLPLTWIALFRREQGPERASAAAADSDEQDSKLKGSRRIVAIALFALVMSLNGFVFSVIAVQLVTLLEGIGLATVTAVWIASLKGFAQFGGRITEIVFARNLHALTVARIATGVLPASFIILLISDGGFRQALSPRTPAQPATTAARPVMRLASAEIQSGDKIASVRD